MIKKITTAIFVTILLSGGILFSTKTANSQVPSPVQIVTDPKHTAATIANWAKNFAKEVAKNWKETLLAQLKKQILDQIVNQTIRWIQGNGDPQFVPEYGGFLGGAGRQSGRRTTAGDKLGRDVPTLSFKSEGQPGEFLFWHNAASLYTTVGLHALARGG